MAQIDIEVVPIEESAGIVGRERAMQRMTDSDGHIAMLAIDHTDDLLEVFTRTSRGDRDVISRIVSAKIDIIGSLAELCSSVLVDARWTLERAIRSGTIPSGIGIATNMEAAGYQNARSATKPTRISRSWSAARVRAMGVDASKLLWYTSDQLSDEVLRGEYAKVEALRRRLHRVGLPLILEPIWYGAEASGGQSDCSARWTDDRVRGTIEVAKTADRLGADLVKIHIPGDSPDVARDACREVSASLDAPWVVLSGGLVFDEFAELYAIAAQEGCSGFIAGRSIWMEAMMATSDSARHSAMSLAVDRLTTLIDTTAIAHPIGTETRASAGEEAS